MTFAEAIGEIASTVGRDIAVIEVPPENYRAELVRQGVPADHVGLIMYLFASQLFRLCAPNGGRRCLEGRPLIM
jgi:hypothetical protein